MNTYQNAPETEKFGGDCLMREIMSDTPRTDSDVLLEARCPSGSALVYADFARQLERELNKARKDAERYRWLRDDCADSPIAVWEWDGQRRIWLAKGELDAAIDAAMRD